MFGGSKPSLLLVARHLFCSHETGARMGARIHESYMGIQYSLQNVLRLSAHWILMVPRGKSVLHPSGPLGGKRL